MLTCIATKCKKRGNSRHIHIDLSIDPWQSKPEAYWQQAINFLMTPGVDTVLKPTGAFKKLTLAAAWS
jgi:hypothetical protein